MLGNFINIKKYRGFLVMLFVEVVFIFLCVYRKDIMDVFVPLHLLFYIFVVCSIYFVYWFYKWYKRKAVIYIWNIILIILMQTLQLYNHDFCLSFILEIPWDGLGGAISQFVYSASLIFIILCAIAVCIAKEYKHRHQG